MATARKDHRLLWGRGVGVHLVFLHQIYLLKFGYANSH